MIDAFYSGASGLMAYQGNLDAIGHNIANTGTIGFKAVLPGSAVYPDEHQFRGGTAHWARRPGVRPFSIDAAGKPGADKRRVGFCNYG